MRAAVPLLQVGVDPIAFEWARTAAIGLGGAALLGGLAAIAAAVGYRRAGTGPLPLGIAVLLGAGAAAAPSTARLVTAGRVFTDVPTVASGTAAYLLAAVVVAGVAGAGGRRLGDHAARELFGVTPVAGDGELAALLRAGGLSVAVTLPETIEDSPDHPPVDAATRNALAGRTLLFPHRLSSEQLRERLVARLERDFGVGHVAVGMDAAGRVERLAVGGRQGGLATTLPPETAAVAVRASPPSTVGLGDPVELWTADDGWFVAAGTLRASTADVATVVLPVDDARAIEPDSDYRLGARSEPSTDRDELVAALRAADVTVAALAVEAGGPLDGEFVDWLPAPVVVLARDGAKAPLAFPDGRETLRDSDTAYVLADPATLRELADYRRDDGATDVDVAATDADTGP